MGPLAQCNARATQASFPWSPPPAQWAAAANRDTCVTDVEGNPSG
jgi:hypothetical protein